MVLFEFSIACYQDEVKNTIRKRNADAVKTATKFLCIMAASLLSLFRLFSIDLMRSIKHSITYYNVIFSSSKPVLSGAEKRRGKGMNWVK